MSRSMLAVAALFLGSACGDVSSPPVAVTPMGSGRIFIRWTIGGQPPTESACRGVAELRLALLGSRYNSLISPIPCALERFRFDHLPEGRTLLRLEAVDSSKCRVGFGEGQTDVAYALPAEPSPTIALPAITPCR